MIKTLYYSRKENNNRWNNVNECFTVLVISRLGYIPWNAGEISKKYFFAFVWACCENLFRISNTGKSLLKQDQVQSIGPTQIQVIQSHLGCLICCLNIFSNPVEKIISRLRSQNTYSKNKLKDDSPYHWIIVYLLSIHRQTVTLIIFRRFWRDF